MKNWKKIGAVMAAAMYVGCATLTSVQAGEPEIFRQLTDGSELRSIQKKEAAAAVDTRAVNLANGFVHIGVIDENTVYLYGKMQGYNVCDRMDMELYLEKSYGSGFTGYKSYTYSAQNVDSLIKSFYVDVEPGYYYRLRGYYLTYHNGLKESGNAYTDGVFVGK